MKSAVDNTKRDMYSSDEEYEVVLETMKEKCEEVKLRLADSNIIISSKTKL